MAGGGSRWRASLWHAAQVTTWTPTGLAETLICHLGRPSTDTVIISRGQLILDRVFPSHDTAQSSDADLESLGCPVLTSRVLACLFGCWKRAAWPWVHWNDGLPCEQKGTSGIYATRNGNWPAGFPGIEQSLKQQVGGVFYISVRILTQTLFCGSLSG